MVVAPLPLLRWSSVPKYSIGLVVNFFKPKSSIVVILDRVEVGQKLLNISSQSLSFSRIWSSRGVFFSQQYFCCAGAAHHGGSRVSLQWPLQVTSMHIFVRSHAAAFPTKTGICLGKTVEGNEGSFSGSWEKVSTIYASVAKLVTCPPKKILSFFVVPLPPQRNWLFCRFFTPATQLCACSGICGAVPGASGDNLIL